MFKRGKECKIVFKYNGLFAYNVFNDILKHCVLVYDTLVTSITQNIFGINVIFS